MSLEDHKLKVFCTVAETKSFSKTSEIVHLTQPAVSLQIQALEEYYETKLFDRTSNTITLSPAGEVLYKYAKYILALYSAAEKEIGKITGHTKGNVVVGASTTIGNFILPSVILDFKKQYTKIKINVHIENTKKIMDLLNTGAIEFGLVEGEMSKYKVTLEPIIEDELFVIVPPIHPWAKKKIISISELTKEPFIFREEGSGTRQITEKFFSSRGLKIRDLNISLTLGSTESIKEAIENGLGVSILSKWVVRKEVKCGNLVTVGIKEGRITRNFYLVMNKNAIISHSVTEFLSFIKSYSYDRLFKD
ncbi:MAG: selenium metabolism-associated LysR family transcriptional regulator [Thermodesulfovibrionales bacterium]|nr:selenium metabolism-associated LysR family transcriptional regulator [Thermodesulfovibrionales bacterium]